MAVTPNVSAHTLIAADSYRAGLRWWLGLPLLDVASLEEPVTCPGCQAEVDGYGDHLLCCPRNNYSNRHNAVQDSLAAILVEAGQPFGREVVIPDIQKQLRPADLLLKGWLAGVDVAVDLTVSHELQAAEQAVAATTVTRERWRGFITRKERAKKKNMR